VNCWETLRTQLTTTELETADVNVLKKMRLGNQQPSAWGESLAKVQRLG